ncbi:MAG: hypothetical protein ACRDL6_10805 [Solirubrobacterales bacterium]
MRATAIAVLACVALAVAACGDDPLEGASCGSTPSPALTPAGSGPDAFTMGIRINQDSDITEVEGQLEHLILPRDVFVVNTEFEKTTPDKAEELVDSLKDKFPCNRIASLNGLARDPGKASYAFALAGNPDVDAILVDWEQISFEVAGKGRWSPSLETNLPRIAENLRLLGEQLKAHDTRMGLAPQYLPPWDYGRTARVIALANFALDPTHLGYQIVQTQENCGAPGAPGPAIGPLAATLRRQYRPLFGQRSSGQGPQLGPVLLQHLGFEIAFTVHPRPNASEALLRVDPRQAAACSQEILNAGGAGILYWATPGTTRAMLDTPIGKKLRSASSS